MSWISGNFPFPVKVSVTTLIVLALPEILQVDDINDDDKHFSLNPVPVETKERKEKHNHKKFQSQQLKKTIKNTFTAILQKILSSVLLNVKTLNFIYML